MEFAVKRSVSYGGAYCLTVFLEDKLGFNGKLNLKDFSYFSLSQLIVEIYRQMAPEHYDWAMEVTLEIIGEDNVDFADAMWRSLDTIASDKIARYITGDTPNFLTFKWRRYLKEFLAYYLTNLVSRSYDLDYNSYLAIILKKGL